MKSNRFTFTLLRPTKEKINFLINLPELKFYFYGMEVGPVSKLVHYQGYFELNNEVHLFKLKHQLKHFYVEIARESAEQNWIYCQKSGNYVRSKISVLDLEKKS